MPRRIDEITEPLPPRDASQKQCKRRHSIDHRITDLMNRPELFASLPDEEKENKIFVLQLIKHNIDITPWLPTSLLKDSTVVLEVIGCLPEGRRREAFIEHAIQVVNEDKKLMRLMLRRNPSYLHIIEPIIEEDLALSAEFNKKASRALKRNISPNVPRAHNSKGLRKWLSQKIVSKNHSITQPMLPNS